MQVRQGTHTCAVEVCVVADQHQARDSLETFASSLQRHDDRGLVGAGKTMQSRAGCGDGHPLRHHGREAQRVTIGQAYLYLFRRRLQVGFAVESATELQAQCGCRHMHQAAGGEGGTDAWREV